jgi:ATP-dependent DNA helicase DinG
MKDILIQLFTEAAKDTPSRDSVKIVDGYWQLQIKGNRDKWGAMCEAAGVPADAEQTISDDTLTVRWVSYADMIFGANGLMANALPNYEMRPGQLHMARLVQRSIEMGEPFVCEAGTGIGKSFAYAAICMAMGKKVIIATSNKALQMQLYGKDIPFLQTLFPGKKMVLAQGKSNYVCWENCRQGVTDQRFADWAQTTKTGSIEELTFDYPDASKYTVDDECTGKRCDFYAQCFYFQQKALRNEADVIICNHSLLALNHHFQGAKILPGVDVVVVDEAHQLPNYVRNAIGWEYYAGMVRKALGKVYDRDQVYVGTAENLLLDFENELVKYISKFGDKQIAVPPETTFESGVMLADELRAVADAVFQADGDVIDKEERKKQRRADALRSLARNLVKICKETLEGHVRWIDVDTPKVINVPFDVSGFIRSMVEHTAEFSEYGDDEDDYAGDEPIQGQPVYIFASATLATPTLKGFKRECGITHGFELIAQSPFDYANNALLYVPNGGTPPPNQPDFLQYLVEEVKGLVNASEGGVFLLFTSWANMKHCCDALRHVFAARFPVYVQGELPKLEIARRFKADGNAVLFATKSFWEGVDIPGDALRCVIIDKMPFAAPSPLFKAREAKSANPFADIALPEMIIDLKQGVGRLVRRATDKGVIAILDSRIRSKPYGRNIVLKSLPPAKLTHSTAMISEFFADGRKASFPDLNNITVSRAAAPTEDFTLVF